MGWEDKRQNWVVRGRDRGKSDKTGEPIGIDPIFFALLCSELMA